MLVGDRFKERAQEARESRSEARLAGIRVNDAFQLVDFAFERARSRPLKKEGFLMSLLLVMLSNEEEAMISMATRSTSSGVESGNLQMLLLLPRLLLSFSLYLPLSSTVKSKRTDAFGIWGEEGDFMENFVNLCVVFHFHLEIVTLAVDKIQEVSICV